MSHVILFFPSNIRYGKYKIFQPDRVTAEEVLSMYNCVGMNIMSSSLPPIIEFFVGIKKRV